jgi:hypothetical protein
MVTEEETDPETVGIALGAEVAIVLSGRRAPVGAKASADAPAPVDRSIPTVLDDNCVSKRDARDGFSSVPNAPPWLGMNAIKEAIASSQPLPEPDQASTLFFAKCFCPL